MYSSRIKFCSSGSDELVESILCVMVVGEAFFAWDFVEVLEEVIAEGERSDEYGE